MKYVFQVGHKYFDTYAGDHSLVSVVEIISRTDKTVLFERDGVQRRAKIYRDSEGEFIIPDRHSMACVYKAEKEYVEPDPVQKGEYSIPDYLLQFGWSTIGNPRINARLIQFLARIMGNASYMMSVDE